MELTIVMPCLNEAETIEICIQKAQYFIQSNKIEGEVVIGDNGSTDGSQEIATSNGARVIDVPKKGYGSALQGAIKAAKGKFIIMGDADDSYDFSSLTPFIEKLRAGFDLVMGNRFKGGIERGAMPFLHRYLGNPILSFFGKLFFNIKEANDFHCGLRGFSKEAYNKLGLITLGMEFASEMVVKASLHELKIIEVPTKLHPDGRSRAPHLNTWPDGWRHLKFLLCYAPNWLFKIPGISISVFSLIIFCWILISPIEIGNIRFDINTAIYSAFAFILGQQLLFFYYFAKKYATINQLIPAKKSADENPFTLERGLVLGAIVFITGIAWTLFNVLFWKKTGFGDLSDNMVRQVIPSAFLIFTGAQTMFFSFISGIMSLKKN